MILKQIRISRSDRTIEVFFDAMIDGTDVSFRFDGIYQHAAEADARIVVESFRAGLASLFEDVRRDEYNRGWKDAKSKRRRKAVHFWSIARRS